MRRVQGQSRPHREDEGCQRVGTQALAWLQAEHVCDPASHATAGTATTGQPTNGAARKLHATKRQRSGRSIDPDCGCQRRCSEEQSEGHASCLGGWLPTSPCDRVVWIVSRHSLGSSPALTLAQMLDVNVAKFVHQEQLPLFATGESHDQPNYAPQQASEDCQDRVEHMVDRLAQDHDRLEV